MIADAPPAIIVPSPEDGHPVRILGLQATGPQADLDRLETAAKAATFPSRQMEGPEGHEILIVFPPGTDPDTAKTFMAQVQDGRFATLTFRSVIIPIR